jgi:hypothetical protein
MNMLFIKEGSLTSLKFGLVYHEVEHSALP